MLSTVGAVMVTTGPHNDTHRLDGLRKRFKFNEWEENSVQRCWDGTDN